MARSDLSAGNRPVPSGGINLQDAGAEASEMTAESSCALPMSRTSRCLPLGMSNMQPTLRALLRARAGAASAASAGRCGSHRMPLR